MELEDGRSWIGGDGRLAGVERLLHAGGVQVGVEKARTTDVQYPWFVIEPASLSDDGQFVANAPQSREQQLEARLNECLGVRRLFDVFLDLPQVFGGRRASKELEQRRLFVFAALEVGLSQRNREDGE